MEGGRWEVGGQFHVMLPLKIDKSYLRNIFVLFIVCVSEMENVMIPISADEYRPAQFYDAKSTKLDLIPSYTKLCFLSEKTGQSGCNEMKFFGNVSRAVLAFVEHIQLISSFM